VRTYQFPAKPSGSGVIELPPELRDVLRPDSELKVVLFIRDASDEAEDQDWKRLASDAFFAGYADSDSIYDED